MSKIKSFDEILKSIAAQQQEAQTVNGPLQATAQMRKKEALMAIDSKIAKADVDCDKAVLDFENTVAGFQVPKAQPATGHHTIDSAALAVEIAEATLARYQKLKNALFPNGSTQNS